MDFLNKMKKREYVQMGLKTAIGILLGIIVIFFMEAMIYSIYMDAIENNKRNSGNSQRAVYYVVDNSNSTYDVYLNYDEPSGAWSLHHDNLSKDDYLEKMIDEKGALADTAIDLVKIEAKKADNTTTTYLAENTTSAISKVKTAYKNNHNNETFTVYTRADNTSDTWTVYEGAENISYYKTVELFSYKGEFKTYSSIKVFFRAPNCFDIYMNATHYIVMVVFLLAIGGVFAWRFTLVSKEYKKLEKKFKKTGKVFL